MLQLLYKFKFCNLDKAILFSVLILIAGLKITSLTSLLNLIRTISNLYTLFVILFFILLTDSEFRIIQVEVFTLANSKEEKFEELDLSSTRTELLMKENL